jgi:phosphoglycolate phosphatase
VADLPALIFDLDGTLLDSAPDIHATANRIFADKGLEPFSLAEVRGFIGNGVGVLVSRLLACRGMEGKADLHADLVADFIKYYEETFDLTKLYPGAAEALTDLRARGHRLAICTNKPEGPARAALRHFGLAPLFPVVVGGDSLPQRKPDPAPLLAAIRAVQASRALFVGDSEVDAETAHAAGVPLALFSGGYRTAPVEALDARIVFDHHAALPRLVAHLTPKL